MSGKMVDGKEGRHLSCWGRIRGIGKDLKRPRASGPGEAVKKKKKAIEIG